MPYFIHLKDFCPDSDEFMSEARKQPKSFIPKRQKILLQSAEKFYSKTPTSVGRFCEDSIRASRKSRSRSLFLRVCSGSFLSIFIHVEALFYSCFSVLPVCLNAAYTRFKRVPSKKVNNHVDKCRTGLAMRSYTSPKSETGFANTSQLFQRKKRRGNAG